jgi:hypothetical protein
VAQQNIDTALQGKGLQKVQEDQKTDCHLPTIVGGESAKGSANTRRSEGNPVSAQRSTDAHSFSQQSRSSYCQQDVRMRNDSVVGGLYEFLYLQSFDPAPLRVGGVSGNQWRHPRPGCISAPQAATEKATPPQDSATPQSKPQLEPKAIEILKAACARLAAAHT